jgi:hypothetical protein
MQNYTNRSVDLYPFDLTLRLGAIWTTDRGMDGREHL